MVVLFSGKNITTPPPPTVSNHTCATSLSLLHNLYEAMLKLVQNETSDKYVLRKQLRMSTNCEILLSLFARVISLLKLKESDAEIWIFRLQIHTVDREIITRNPREGSSEKFHVHDFKHERLSTCLTARLPWRRVFKLAIIQCHALHFYSILC